MQAYLTWTVNGLKGTAPNLLSQWPESFTLPRMEVPRPPRRRHRVRSRRHKERTGPRPIQIGEVIKKFCDQRIVEQGHFAWTSQLKFGMLKRNPKDEIKQVSATICDW